MASRVVLWVWVMVALSLAACGSGVEGIATPPPMDLGAIVRPTTPNTALAGPAGYVPAPDVTTPVYAMPADALYAAVVAMAARQRRTFLLARYDDQRQAHFVARSAVLGFPDLIAVQAVPAGPGRSTLVIWSRSVYGHYDFGVNRRRVQSWLAALRPAPG